MLKLFFWVNEIVSIKVHPCKEQTTYWYCDCKLFRAGVVPPFRAQFINLILSFSSVNWIGLTDRPKARPTDQEIKLSSGKTAGNFRTLPSSFSHIDRFPLLPWTFHHSSRQLIILRGALKLSIFVFYFILRLIICSSGSKSDDHKNLSVVYKDGDSQVL